MVAGLAQFDEGVAVARPRLLTVRTIADVEIRPLGIARPQIAAQASIDLIETFQFQRARPPDRIEAVLGGKDGTGEPRHRKKCERHQTKADFHA